MSILLSLTLFAFEAKKSEPKYIASVVPKKMSVSAKKKRFYALVVPAINKVYKELQEQFITVSKDIKQGRNTKNIAELKRIYKVKSDKELLLALKPHPPSIALAQAAIESSWGTSRFFTKANNTFGIWSYSKNKPRIAAKEMRDGKKTIWLRKFNSIEDSIRAYYRMMGRAKAYKEFRKVRFESDDVFKIIKKLNRYSELKEKYTVELAKIIRYNKLKKYD
ncbi:glucosaminidase domain-containing protein [Sulfurimonas sp.]|uniref:glucosaminidase domain-containing protein n=1 Tax=Sulfurimonas sp. TaxID=2022749 RepID=UPI00262A3287|nr:glucosaminidase domain-containing protein [Sulfurimonas sp.]MCW8895825.1 glucosaminidase domain-containing protein [Sulfurimonas sp.]MCW9067822.1 glucosaminidase domain-containing protein [Sulfurimonas sp.]